MAVTINASTSAGLVNTADTSGVLQLQTAGTTAVTISSGQVATFAQPPVLPAASIPQAALAAGVAGNGPAFNVTLGITQSITTNTWTKTVLDTKTFDTASAFNNTSGTVGGIPAYAFKPSIAGYYQINAASILQSASANVIYTAISLYKTGVPFTYGTYGNISASAQSGVVLSDVLYFNGTSDYVELYVYASATSPFATNSRLSAALVRSA